MNTTRNLRSGMTTIPIIAFYAVAMTLIAVWVQSALRDRRQVDRWREHTQTCLLAEAGIRRAIAQVNHSGNTYEGETWVITSDELGLPHDAQVEIQLTDIIHRDGEKATSPSGAKRIIAVAEYPLGPSPRNRVSKQFELGSN